MDTNEFSNSEKIQKEYYNKISKEYEEHYSNEYAIRYRNNLFNNFLKDIDFKDKQVLDAMCGGGQNAVFFTSRGAKITGVDISEEQCELFRKKYPESKVLCRSILNSGLEDQSFDLIIADSLHHIHPNVDDCMKEFHRLLKKNGYLILWEPSAGSILDILRKRFYEKDENYFEENEASIELQRLTDDNKSDFKLVKKTYGGNLAYLFVLLTMALRIPTKFIKYYAKPTIYIENFFNLIQFKEISLWFLALYKKI